jgi:nucleotide-binding universal stress UspA family protein
MVGSTTGDTPSTPSDTPLAPFVVEPVDIAHIVVPLDGSPFAERALAVADWVAAAVGAAVQLVQVVAFDDDEGAEGAIRYLDSACRQRHAASWDVVQRNDVALALADAVAGSPKRMACLATHGWGRGPGIGAVAVSLLERSNRPLLLVGPVAGAVTAVDAPVVVAVDGTARDELLVPVALGWAARLARRLDIVTVAEPTPPRRLESARPWPAHRPAGPGTYVESLAARARTSGVAVVPRVVYDRVSVGEGLVPLLDRGAALVVLGSRRLQSRRRMVPGSQAERIVNGAAVPALVVPLPLGA